MGIILEHVLDNMWMFVLVGLREKFGWPCSLRAAPARTCPAGALGDQSRSSFGLVRGRPCRPAYVLFRAGAVGGVLAVSDHKRAQCDHKRAQFDHKRAQFDHTRAQFDSLGAILGPSRELSEHSWSLSGSSRGGPWAMGHGPWAMGHGPWGLRF